MAPSATRPAANGEPVVITAADGHALHGLLVRASVNGPPASAGARITPDGGADARVHTTGDAAAGMDARIANGGGAGAGANVITPRGALVINSGAGFPREFYLKFASYASQRGYHALIYDYRGLGAGARDSSAKMIDWGRLDIPAAFHWLSEQFPDLPLFTVGHSIGGQFLGFIPDDARARGHVMIAVSFAYWRWEPFPFRYVALFFWKVFGPLMLSRHGYVPQGRMWSGLSLPRGVYLQWRQWALRKTHFVPDLTQDERDNKFGALRGPVLAYQFEDDPIATHKTAPPLFALYPAAEILQRWIHPKSIGVHRIGHQGFFSERCKDTLWSAVLGWVDERAIKIAETTIAPPAI